MDPYDEQQLSELQRYGFDPELQRRWQRDIAEGRLSKATNVVSGDLLVPPPGTVHKQPGRNTRAYRELEQLGIEAIRGGKLGVVVLNGGVTSSFGGAAKGTVPVLSDARSFLGLAVEDILGRCRSAPGDIAVFCMNSFATDAATRAHFHEHANFGLEPDAVEHFTQSVAVQMDERGTLLLSKEGKVLPYTPGHGDFAAAFQRSGALRRFRDRGGRYLLVRNVDNLGARVDPIVLGHHIQTGCEMTAEVAPKWPDDVGGSPYQYLGRTQLIEPLRCPEGLDQDIVDVFNTNSFTFSAEALDQGFDLGWYYVERELNGRTYVQVERSIGEMTAHLATSFLQVRRSGRQSRFLPVKSPEDLQSAAEEIAEMYDGAPEEDLT